MSALCVLNGVIRYPIFRYKIAYVLSVTGSADAILALVNAGANVEADDKDGLTGIKQTVIFVLVVLCSYSCLVQFQYH